MSVVDTVALTVGLDASKPQLKLVYGVRYPASEDLVGLFPQRCCYTRERALIVYTYRLIDRMRLSQSSASTLVVVTSN